jgi:predicted CoA-binding protein
MSIAEEAVAINAPLFWGQLGVVNEKAFYFLKGNGVTTIMDRCIVMEYARLIK